jgi:N-acylneuraminate cytidylyltransferase
MNIAIIPARGGSKRIPRKNIKLFHGKPMIAYSIEAAKKSGCFDKIIVSTDDQEIAEVAKQYGAEVPFIRPANISDDFATTLDVMQHAINWCHKQNWSVNNVCCIYATAPFILSEYILQGLTLLAADNVQYVFSATTFAFPIQRAIALSDNGEVSMFSPEHEKTRSQDLPEAYHDAGQFYWGKESAFKNAISIFSEHSRVILLPRSHVQDIDTPEDWDLALTLYSAL